MNGNAEQYRITESRVFVDIYRLLTAFLASDRLNSLRDELDMPYGSIISVRRACEKEEIHELLLKLAASFRVQQDQVPDHLGVTGPTNINPYHDNCGQFYPDNDDTTSEVLKLREACNKIIHATEFEHSHLTKNDPNDYSLDSKMILRGQRFGKRWRAELDIIRFADCLFYNFKLD